jgi:hypothetical protein
MSRIPDVPTRFEPTPRQDDYAGGKWLIVAFLLSAAFVLGGAALLWGSV